MQHRWKKTFLRHGLFSYSRNTLLLFVNLFVWSQDKDLRVVALFNMVFLVMHTIMFWVLLPIIKRGYGQRVMKTGILGLSIVLGSILLLGEQTITHIYTIGFFVGVFNGMYWLVNHLESLDIAVNKNRTSFLAFRKATQGVAALAVPGVGWAMFSIFGDNNSGYTAVFSVALVSLLVAWAITYIPQQKESKLDLKQSLRIFKQTKHAYLLLGNVFLYGLTFRSVLSTVLLPFLIFQVVEKESSLNMIQTLVEILAIIAVYYFGMHKKNTNYITKLFLIAGGTTLIGLSGLFFELSFTTYLVYFVTYVVALSAANISSSTMSLNFISTIKESNNHRIEFLVLRETPTIAGFIGGYAFVYFYPNLTVDSLRPLLAIIMVATILNVIISIFLWQYVQEFDKNQEGLSE